MSLVTVTRNVDNTFTVTLDDRANRVLKRWSTEDDISKAQELENIITDFFNNKIHEYKNRDGPLMAEKYEALDEAQKKLVDTILFPQT